MHKYLAVLFFANLMAMDGQLVEFDSDGEGEFGRMSPSAVWDPLPDYILYSNLGAPDVPANVEKKDSKYGHCLTCDKPQTHLQRHMVSMHNVESKHFCTTCRVGDEPRYFYAPWELQRHMKSHGQTEAVDKSVQIKQSVKVIDMQQQLEEIAAFEEVMTDPDSQYGQDDGLGKRKAGSSLPLSIEIVDDEDVMSAVATEPHVTPEAISCIVPPAKRFNNISCGWTDSQELDCVTAKAKVPGVTAAIVKSKPEKAKRKKHSKDPQLKKTCNICGKEVFNLSQHQVGAHNFETDFKCKESKCHAEGESKYFFSQSLLDNHMVREHNKQGKFPCISCSESFNFFSELSDHKITNHQEKSDFYCATCAIYYRDKSDLDRHLLSHGIGQTEFQCSVCSRYLAREGILRDHEKACSRRKGQLKASKKKK